MTAALALQRLNARDYRRPTISLRALQLGKLQLVSSMETETNLREYSVRACIDSDHPTISDSRIAAERMGMKPYECIAIIRLCDGKKWIVGSRTVNFPKWENTDDYAQRRLALNVFVKARMSWSGR